MPRGRGSSGGGFGGRSSSSSSNYGSRSASPSYSQPRTQQPNHQQATPVQRGGGMMGGIGSTIMTGMAFGAGSEIAHQAVRGIMGGGSHNQQQVPQQTSNEIQQQPMQNQQQQQQQQNPCMSYNLKFVECLKFNDNSISSCQTLFDDLKSCEKSLI
jgi:hypothetical protein